MCLFRSYCFHGSTLNIVTFALVTYYFVFREEVAFSFHSFRETQESYECSMFHQNWLGSRWPLLYKLIF